MITERGKQLRRDIIELSGAHGGYHYGGCFSAVEILSVLYDEVMGPDDLFILSKGHACWVQYVLLREQGLNPRLEGHPTRDPANGVHATTGSLGHGLPMALGIAMARKIQGKPGRVFVVMGDGECQEGTTWESLLIARRHKVDNLVIIVDFNRLQGSGKVDDVLSIQGIAKIGEVLGCYIQDPDGHDEQELNRVLQIRAKNQPLLVLAQTVKGKGVSFMEDQPEWHACWLDGEQKEQALKELEATL